MQCQQQKIIHLKIINSLIRQPLGSQLGENGDFQEIINFEACVQQIG